MESEIIQNAIDFSDTVAKEVMTPRKDMVCLSKQKSLEENLQIIKETKYTRFPFIDGSKDTVLGLIHIRDILHAMLKNKEVDFNSIIREFIIVPENSSISNILNMMNKEKTYAALVLDEYGGTAGFVTLEDIVGEVFDEFEPDDDEEYKRIDDLNYEFSGRYELEELGEMLDMSFDDEQITIGGYVFNLFGRLPEVGESVSDDRCVYEVLAMDGAAIRRIKLTLKSYGIAKKAGVVAGVSYLDVIFSLILGLFLGDAFPSAMVFAGILGIIFGGLILVFDKAKP